MAVGSYTVGLCLKIMNRRQVILMSVIGISISNLLIAVVHNIMIFAVFRFIGTVFLGYYTVIIFSIQAEYLPVRFRGFVMNFIWLAWNIGGIYFLLFCKIYIPNLSYDPLDKTTPQDFNAAIFSIFYVEIINLVLVFFFLKDSPRNLFINNKKEEKYLSDKLNEVKTGLLNEVKKVDDSVVAEYMLYIKLIDELSGGENV